MRVSLCRTKSYLLSCRRGWRKGTYRGESGFILEGISRNRIQAEILDQFADIDLVLNFKCTEEDLVRKNLGIMTITQSIESTLSDKGGSSNRVSPGDDVGGHWKEKYSLYIQQIKLLEDYYHEQKKLLNFQVASAPAETWGLLAALHLQWLNAVRCRGFQEDDSKTQRHLIWINLFVIIVHHSGI